MPLAITPRHADQVKTSPRNWTITVKIKTLITNGPCTTVCFIKICNTSLARNQFYPLNWSKLKIWARWPETARCSSPRFCVVVAWVWQGAQRDVFRNESKVLVTGFNVCINNICRTRSPRVRGNLRSPCTTSLDTRHPSTIFCRLLLNWASVTRH
jgi:hypothetical protein